MRLTPPEPSFLDARNAILQADQALFGGVHASGIWDAFAARGMGFFAGTEDASDVAPVESFAPPPPADAPTGQISGRVADSDSGRPLEGIVVGVGGLATAPSAYTATTAADGTYTIGPLPAGTYPVLTFRGGAGYERRSSRSVTVEAGATRTLDVSLRRNWSALAGGATVSATNDDSSGPFGCGVDQAIDGDPGTGWSAFVPTSAGAFGIVNPHRGVAPTMTVELPATIDVTAFGIDPSNTCGDDVTAATKDLRIEVSSDGTTFTTALEHSFGAEDRGRLNVIGASAAALGVRFVRVTLLSNQRPAGAGGAGVNFVDLSELAVYGASQLADPPAGEAPAPEPAPGDTPPQEPAPGDTPPAGTPSADPAPADPATGRPRAGRNRASGPRARADAVGGPTARRPGAGRQRARRPAAHRDPARRVSAPAG